MKILGGIYKGRNLVMPRGAKLRPTRDLVRKALFDVLGERVVAARLLELFAGTGAVAFEALSLGAASAVIVEEDRACLKAIYQNIEALGLKGCRVISKDALLALAELSNRSERFDIIFLDPPYYGDILKKTLQRLSGYDILAHNGLVIAEHFKKDELPNRLGNLELQRSRRYGDTVLSFYKHRHLCPSVSFSARG